MRIIAKRVLIAFGKKHPQAKTPLDEWQKVVSKCHWEKPDDIRQFFNHADFIADNRVIFNIAGNKYRLIVHVAYKRKAILIKFIGTHKFD